MSSKATARLRGCKSEPDTLAPGRSAGGGRHRRRLPCRQGAARPPLNSRRTGRDAAPGWLAALDGEPDDGGRRHGDRLDRRPAGTSPPGDLRHRAVRRLQLNRRDGRRRRSAAGGARGRGPRLHHRGGRDPDPAAAHRHAARPAAGDGLLDDLHAGRRRFDDADCGPRPARHVVALGVVDRRRRVGRHAARAAADGAATGSSIRSP